MRYAGLDSSS